MDGKDIGKSIIAFVPSAAPGVVGRFLLPLLDAALAGFGGVGSVPNMAGAHLQRTGHPELAINSLIKQHILLAGTQGFITNLGGLTTMWWAGPVNLSGLAVLHTRLVGSIAHLRGYDLDDSRVRHAILTTLLGKRIVNDLVRKGELPGAPIVLATSPGIDHSLEELIAERVTMALLTTSSGKQLTGLVARKVPLIGGGVGLVTDSWNTNAIGQYAKEQFVSRRYW